MTYLEIIPLADAKNYLRIDDTLTEDDSQITRMIESAFSYIEKSTNVILKDKEKTFYFTDNYSLVYDFPINSVTSPAGTVRTEKQQYSIYYTSTTDEKLVLNVGYSVVADVPKELIDVAYEIIDILYYEHETGKSVKKDLSSMSLDILNQYKRFII